MKQEKHINNRLTYFIELLPFRKKRLELNDFKFSFRLKRIYSLFEKKHPRKRKSFLRETLVYTKDRIEVHWSRFLIPIVYKVNKEPWNKCLSNETETRRCILGCMSRMYQIRYNKISLLWSGN